MAKKKEKHKHRNASSGGGATRRFSRAKPPSMEEIVASVVGGGGGALAGALLTRWGLSPAMTSLTMLVGGGVGSFTTGGNPRIALHGVAAAGAGQLALHMLAKRAERVVEEKLKQQQAAAQAQSPTVAGAPAQPQLANAAGSLESTLDWAHGQVENDNDDDAQVVNGYREERYAA